MSHEVEYGGGGGGGGSGFAEEAPAPAGAGNTLEATVSLLQDHEAKPNPTAKPPTNPTLAFDRLQPVLLAKHLASPVEATVALALQGTHALLGERASAAPRRAAGKGRRRSLRSR